MVIAVAISSRSSDFTRRTMFSIACSNGRPRLTSRMTRANSVEIGGRDSRTTSSIACRNEDPAPEVVGEQRDRVRQLVERVEAAALAVQPDARDEEADECADQQEQRVPSVGRMTDRTTMISGCRRSTRPRSWRTRTASGAGRRERGHARGWRRSRCSTTLLRLASARLWAIMSLIGPCTFAASGFGVEA